MKVYLHEIKETDTELDVSDSDAWVRDAVVALDEDRASVPGSPEALRPSAAKAAPTARPTRIHYNLRRVDDVIVVSGDISTSVQLLCSRCAAPFLFPIDEHFTALYCKDKEMAGISYLDHDSNPRGQNKGHARHAHDFDAQSGNEASEDLEITYIAEEYLDLAQVLSEQVRLRIPFQPLCKADCKGVCATCGADWNVGRCACSKIIGKSPFAVLKNLKT